MNIVYKYADLIVYEDERSQYDQYLKSYRKLFSRFGDLSIDYCYDPLELSERLRLRPISLICDIQLENQPAEGLKIISTYKNAYPDILFIGVSREVINLEQFGANYPNPDLLINKVALRNDPDYLEYLSDEIGGLIKRLRLPEISFENNAKGMFDRFVGKKPSTVELRSLLSQVIYTNYNTQDNSHIQKIIILPFEGGYSGSSVAEVRFVTNSNEMLGVAGVIKISRLNNTIMEIDNYNKYVKWFLPYSWRVDILGTGFTDKYGVVCYSFVHKDGAAAKTLTDLIKSGKAKESVSFVVNTVFNPASKTWYNHIRSGEDEDLSLYYSKYAHNGKAKRLGEMDTCLYNNLRKICDNDKIACAKEGDYIVINNEKYIMPIYLLFSQDWGRYDECICHGDLNSGNIMFNSSLDKVVFIDFQQTGYAHVYLDFIVLESSLRLHYPFDKSNGKRLDLIKMIYEEYNAIINNRSGCKEGDIYYECIQSIRSAAYNNFKNDVTSYMYGVAVMHLWLLKMEKWTDVQYYRLVSIILAALKWLNETKGK